MLWVNRIGSVVACAIFTGYNKANIDAHLIVKRPSIAIQRQIYRYVFLQLKCLRLTGYVPASNAKLVKLVNGLGWRLEGALEHYYGPREGDTALIYGLHAEDVDHGKLAFRTHTPRPEYGRSQPADL
jgi:hypothetical protein